MLYNDTYPRQKRLEKSPTIYQKELCILWKKPYVLSKEPEEPYILSK